MKIQDISRIVAEALKSVHASKATVFQAQRACVQFAMEHNNWSPMSRLIVGLQNTKVYNGKALLVFVLETCGADKQGKNGSLGWNAEKKSLFIRQGKVVEARAYKLMQNKPFWEHAKPQSLTLTSVDIIRASVAKVEKSGEENKLADWVPSDDAMVKELWAVLKKYNRHESKREQAVNG